MASIQTAIQLTDRVTAPLHNITSALSIVVNEFNRVHEVSGNSFNVDAINSANAKLNIAEQELNQITTASARAETSQSGLNNKWNAGGSALDGLIKKGAQLMATYASILGAQKLISLSDSLAQTESRLNLIVDDGGSVDELKQKIMDSANRSRASYIATSSTVASLAQRAGDAFKGNDEVIGFAETLNKMYVIAGTTAQEQASSMLQLTQALGSGVLRGEEFNAVFEAAPNIMQYIADYMNVPIGQLRNMAAEGQITADIVKNAIMGATEQVNQDFESMSMTWGQVFTGFQNSALLAFQPVLDKINELANNEQFINFVENAIGALAQLVVYVLGFFDTLSNIGSFISDNWSVIAPIVFGVIAALTAYMVISGIVAAMNGIMATSESIHAAALAMQSGATFAATAAQYGLNSALMACPLTWIILLIIALIAIIFAVCSAIAKLTGIADSGFGVITGGINVVIQFFKNLGLSIANIALGIGNAIGALGYNIMTAFHNAICSVQSWWYDLLSTVLGVVEGICEALNEIPFIDFDYSGISAAADDYATKSAEAESSKREYKDIGDAFNSGMNTFDTFQSGWASDAFNAGASWGDGVSDKVSGMFDFNTEQKTEDSQSSYNNALENTSLTSAANQTASNTADISDKLDVASNQLKYIREYAEREAINRFTTANINVNMTNNNNVSSETDLDGIMDTLKDGIQQQMNIVAEGA